MTYHHGDLRKELLAAALVQIQAHGVASLSMRALARSAGVSATAPYRHFDGKRSLLAALAQQGFEGLETNIKAVLQPQADLRDRLLALGQAYVDFAVANPTSYQLMFGSVIDDFSEYAPLQAAADSAFAVLLEVLQEIIDAGGGGGLDRDTLGGATWSIVHGMASLHISDLRTELYQHRPLQPGAAGPIPSVEALRRNSTAALQVLLQGLLPTD